MLGIERWAGLYELAVPVAYLTRKAERLTSTGYSMTLTADMFQPVGGDLFAHLHENSMTGFPRALYWSATVRFAPFRVAEELVEASATIEWLNFNDRVMTGQHKVATPNTHPGGEASLYTFMHQATDDWHCALDFATLDHPVPYHFAMTVDAYAFEGKPRLALKGATALDFGGIILVKDNLPEKPQTVAAARALIAPYFDLTTYHCEESDWQFVFRPAPAVL
jgi:hypothetical protein